MHSLIGGKEHQLLLDAIKDHAIFMMDVDGLIISWNDGATRLKGFTKEDVIGQHYRMLFQPEDKEKKHPERGMQEALATGKFEEEWWRMKKDGSRFWAHVSLQPIFDEGGEHIGFAKVTSDITEQKRINDLNDFLMNEVTGYAIFLLDKGGKVSKWSKAAESIIGFKEEEVLGKSLSILYLDNAKGNGEREVQQHLAEALNDRYEEEGWKVRKDGSHFWANYIITPLHNKEEYVVLIRDLTDKRAFEQESKANTSLTTTNKQLERFASVISHELKEPIRKISVFSHMLKADSPAQGQLIDRILLSCNRATNLLESIVELAFVTHLKEPVEQDLNVVVKNVLDLLDEEVKEKGAVIKYHSLPRASFIPGQVELLVQNLIGNALRFCCTDGETPVIHIEGSIVPKEKLETQLLDTMRHSERYLQIKVTDNGIGFEQEYSSKVFDFFTRLHGLSEYEGTGVGLAICKRVAENHGGSIAAFSEKGKGTLIVITFPYNEAPGLPLSV